MSATTPGRVGVVVIVVGAALAGYGVHQSLQAPKPSNHPPAVAELASQPGGSLLSRDITRLQLMARQNPGDASSLALLGLDYVQQAKITVDPSYYPKAKGVLARSLALQTSGNYQAMAGEAAYFAALHDFTAARTWALRGLAVDSYSATLYGALADAQTQLGQYAAAEAAVQKMLNVNPGVPALTRAEYVYELRGQLPQARAMLARALTAASDPSDIAFVRQISSELDLNSGDAPAALSEAVAGLRADPAYTSLLEQKAKAEAAMGQQAPALSDYAQLVASAPQPQYLVEYGEYLDSLGQHPLAKQQYAVFDVEGRLFTANGVTLDTDPTLFYADHADPARALRYGRAGLAIRPFLEMQDAYAWALHVNGQDELALTYAQKAASLGTRNALFDFHRGMIEKALGQRARALASLRQALALNPHFNPLQAPIALATVHELATQ